jgi:hypothetical protein
LTALVVDASALADFLLSAERGRWSTSVDNNSIRSE